MFIVIGFMFAGMLTGYVFKKKQVTWVGKLITVLIWLLLFLFCVRSEGQNAPHAGKQTNDDPRGRLFSDRHRPNAQL